MMHVEALRQKAVEGRFAGLLSIVYDDGEWLITLGGQRSDACWFAHGPTFEAAAAEMLARRP